MEATDCVVNRLHDGQAPSSLAPAARLVKQTTTRIPLIGFVSMTLAAFLRYFYYTMQFTSIAYRKSYFLIHVAALIGESITFQTLYETIAGIVPKRFWQGGAIKVALVAIVSFLVLLQLFQLFVSLFDLVFNYGAISRLVADNFLSYSSKERPLFANQPILFDTTMPKEGKPFTEPFFKVFLHHMIDGQKAQMYLIIGWFGFCFLLYMARMFQTIYFQFRAGKIQRVPIQRSPKQKKAMQLISVATVLAFLAYCFVWNGDRFDDMVPSNWYLYRSSIKQGLPANVYLKSVKDLRAKYTLPEGEDWLDQREVPVYPLVHAPKAFVDAYNHHKPANVSREIPENLPNIVFLLWESFTPMPKYVTDEVILNQDSVFKGQPYRRDYLPHLAKLAETGHSFMGVRSNGVPTINGWHSLVTGEISSYKGINMISSATNDFDDFATKFKQMGYYNLMVWPSGFETDKKTNYVFRGRPDVDTPDYLKDTPLWFDEIHQFYPTVAEAELMGIKDYPKRQRMWTNDRLCSQQFNYFFNQRVKEVGKPVFGFFGNVDTHEDFNGFDDDIQFKEFEVGVGRSNRFDVYGRHDAYSTVLKYSDAQFGRIIENLRQNAPHTIVVALGDHASRQVPIYVDAEKKINEDAPFTFDMACVNKSAAYDQQFTTSAVISYLGQDEKVLKLLDGIINQTSFEPADHHDVVHTVFQMLAKLGAEDLPSSRLGVNLIDQVHNMQAGKPSVQQPKLSITHLNMEYSDNTGLYRMSLHGPHNGHQVVKILPSCIAGQNSIIPHVSRKTFEDAKQMMKLVTFLSEHNQWYSYAFRNSTCVADGSCEFPEPNPVFANMIVPKIMLSIGKASLKLLLAMLAVDLAVKTLRLIGRGIVYVVRK